MFFLLEKKKRAHQQPSTHVCNPRITNPGRDMGGEVGNEHLEVNDSVVNLNGVISCSWVNQLG